VIGWLLGEGLNLTGTAVARVLGIGLLSLGVAALETARQQVSHTSRVGICTFNIGVAGLLAILAATGKVNGALLWPAAGRQKREWSGLVRS
jgi:hypothetical protein